MPRVLLVFFATIFTLVGVAAFAQGFDTKAKQAYLLDAATGSVLFQKNADEAFPPASLAKLMTMEVVFASIVNGQHKTGEIFVVSENAWRTGGAPSGTATMFAKLKSQIALQDLIKGAIIQSANDACIIIAEGFEGSEIAFAATMNARAKTLGLTKSSFVNATGLPEDGQQVTVRDIGLLSRHLIKTYPQLFPIFAEPEFKWGNITQRNRNPLLGNFDGADGLGLGYTKDIGYAIAATAKRGDLRLIAVLAGMASEKERAEEARRILEWGFTGFEALPVFQSGEFIGQANVFGGTELSVPLVTHGPVTLLVAMGNSERLKARVRYLGPLVAPVVKDQPVGTLQISLGDTLIQETPVYAADDVARGSLWQRAFSAAKELLTGWIRSL